MSTICLLFCGIYFSSNKSLGIWSLFGFLVFGLLTGFLYWQNDIWQTQANKNPVVQTEKAEKNSTEKQILSPQAPPQKAKKENKKMKEEAKPTIIAPNSVVSVDQKGGITAGTVISANTVNFVPQNRRITPEQLEILLPALKTLCGIKIRISYATGDKERKQFAEDIINAFLVAGCKPEVPPPPVVLASPYGKGLSFGVNSEPPYADGMALLQQALIKANIASEWLGFPDIPRAWLIVSVGERP